jgi:hypothetical protein
MFYRLDLQFFKPYRAKMANLWIVGNVIESWNGGEVGKQKTLTSKNFSFDSQVTHIQLNQFWQLAHLVDLLDN